MNFEEKKKNLGKKYKQLTLHNKLIILIWLFLSQNICFKMKYLEYFTDYNINLTGLKLISKIQYLNEFTFFYFCKTCILVNKNSKKCCKSIFYTLFKIKFKNFLKVLSIFQTTKTHDLLHSNLRKLMIISLTLF